MSFYLIQNYFESIQREEEHLKCLKENISNVLIEEIHLLCSDGVRPNIESEKIKYVDIMGTPTYREIFEYCNENLEDKICILSNLDIYFNDSIKHVGTFLNDKTVLALSRWELTKKETIISVARNDSQDVWIFKSPLNTKNMNIDFGMGIPACDNVLAFELFKNYSVRNPSKTIKSIHVHLTNYRGQSAQREGRLKGEWKRVNIE